MEVTQNVSSKATYIETFKKNLIATKRLEFKEALKSSERVAEAAAIEAVEELLSQPVDLNDFSMLSNLDQKRQLFIIRLLMDGTTPKASTATGKDGKGAGVARPGVRIRWWKTKTNYDDDRKQEAFAKMHGFDTFLDLVMSPQNEELYNKAKAEKK